MQGHPRMCQQVTLFYPAEPMNEASTIAADV